MVTKMAINVALVTGGASGIGRVYALRMAQAGIQVAVLDRDEAALADIARQSVHITTVCCDVADTAAVNAVVAQVGETLGRIDRLVLCAAIMPTDLLARQSPQLINQIMTVNYCGTVNVVSAVLPAMLDRQSGEIVIFGSTGGSVLMSECGAYCASKAAINAYAEILIEENEGSGVDIMLVCPALVDTPLLQQATQTSNPKSIQYSIANKRFASPEYITDQLERGLARKLKILKPGFEAKMVMWLRRMAPGLLWSVIKRSNKK